MDKRLAKRWACTHAAIVIDSAIGAGWEYDRHMSEDDARRATDALNEVIEELRKRGLTEDDPRCIGIEPEQEDVVITRGRKSPFAG